MSANDTIAPPFDLVKTLTRALEANVDLHSELARADYATRRAVERAVRAEENLEVARRLLEEVSEAYAFGPEELLERIRQAINQGN